MNQCNKALEEVQKAGVKVMYPDNTPFRKSVHEMYESYRGTPIYELIQQITSME
jgi:TRAP-type C4-dicarboxylate transport system substrate-binding protein